MDVVHITVSAKNLDTVPIINGQIIAISDKSAYYYDMDNVRHRVSGTEVLTSKPTTSTVTGIEGILYICKNPPGLWIYENNAFVQIISGAISTNVTGSGNVVSSVDANNMTLNIHKDVIVPTKAEFDAHVNKKDGNPHGVTKEDVGLGNVDNTADRDKAVREATKLTTPRAIDGIDFDGSKDSNRYCSCSTPAATQLKIVTVEGFNLQNYATINVRFELGNTAESPQLNVNGTGAKPIKYLGQPVKDPNLIKPEYILTLIYLTDSYNIAGGIDTTYGLSSSTSSGLMSAEQFNKLASIQQGATANAPYTSNPLPDAPTASPGSSDLYARGDHVHPIPANTPTNSASATRLQTARSIDGVLFDGTQNVTHFAVCDTAADATDKVVTISGTSGIDLKTGLQLIIFFNHDNTYIGTNIVVNGNDPIPLNLNGSAISDPTLIKAGVVVHVVYTGTAFEIVSITSKFATTAFTSEDKAKLDSLHNLDPYTGIPAADAEEGFSGDVDLYARGNHVHPHSEEFKQMRTKLSTIQDNANKVDPSDADPMQIGETSPGVSSQYARADHVHANSGEVIDALEKLAGISEGANRVLPSDELPSELGEAAPGVSDQYARADHVHPIPDMSNAETADRLTNPVNITLQGAVSGTAEFDGSTDIVIDTTNESGTFDYENNGLVPKPENTAPIYKYLRDDGTWQIVYTLLDGTDTQLLDIINSESTGTIRTILINIEGEFTCSGEEITTDAETRLILDFANMNEMTGYIDLSANIHATIRNLKITRDRMIVLENPVYVDFQFCYFDDTEAENTMLSITSATTVGIHNCTVRNTKDIRIVAESDASVSMVYDIQNNLFRITREISDKSLCCIATNSTSSGQFSNNLIRCNKGKRKDVRTRVISRAVDSEDAEEVTDYLDIAYNNMIVDNL